MPLATKYGTALLFSCLLLSLTLINRSWNDFVSVIDNVVTITPRHRQVAALEGSGSGLVGWWKFDEGTGTTATDSSGNNNTGTLTNGPTWVAGKVGGALEFNGTNSYTQMADNASLSPGTGELTVALWFKTSATPGAGTLGTLYSDRGSISNNLIYLAMNGSTNKPECLIRDSAGQSMNLSDSGTVATKNDGQWHFIACVKNSQTTGVFYADSFVRNATNASLGAVTLSDGNPPKVGSMSGSSLFYFNGTIDDVRVYSRALSAQEITDLYNAGLSGGGSSPPPASSGDTTAPSVPTNLSATTISSSQINLSWTASTDDTAVTGYKIYRDGNQITTVSGTTYNNTGLTPNTSYSYTVSAYDAANNTSSQSSPVSAATQAIVDTTAPTLSAGSPSGQQPAGATQATLQVTTNEPSTCKYGTVANTAYASIANIFTTTGGNSHSAIITGLTNGSSYTYRVRCQDTATNTNTSDYNITFSVSVPTVTNANSQYPGVLIPSNRLVDWTPGVSVGVPGGIPTNRTNLIDVTQAPYNADKTGAANAQSAIQGAINAAKANDVIYLPAGRYLITGAIYTKQNQGNITIRGAGMDATIVDCRVSSVCFSGGISNGWESPTIGNTITSGLNKGSTQITISDTSAFPIGQLALIRPPDNKDLPVISVMGYPNNRRQVVQVRSKTATTLTYWPPLYDNYDYTVGFQKAYVRVAMFHANYIGFEDFTIDGSNSPSGPMVGIRFQQTYGSWIKNVKVRKASNYSFSVNDSLNCEIRHSYVDSLNHSGSNGAGLLFNTNSGCLVEDNIIYKAFPLIEVNAGASGNVFAYNFLEDSAPGAAIDTNHAPHNQYNLYEGNISPNLQSDGYYGSASHDTVFRNWLHGVAPGSTRSGWNLSLNRFTRNYSVVGNIFGWSGYTSTTKGNSFGNPNMGNGVYEGATDPGNGIFWQDWNPATGPGITGTLTTRTSDSQGVVTVNNGNSRLIKYCSVFTGGLCLTVGLEWNTGVRNAMQNTTYSGNALSLNGGYSTPLPPEGTTVGIWPRSEGFQELDNGVLASTILRGNYYNFSGSIPTDQSLDGLSIPNSLYLSTKPSWFGTLVWPPFNPLSPNPAYDAIPAGYRYVHSTEAPGVSSVYTPPVSSIPTPGSCSSSLNTCSTGTFFDTGDSTTEYLWSCLGSPSAGQGQAGGSTASCSLPKNVIPTPTPAPVIPNISSITLTKTSKNSTISFTTDKPTSYQIEYGLTTAYGSQTALSTPFVNYHSISLPNLNPNTTYHYRIRLRDIDGNLVLSPDYTFTTLVSTATTPVTTTFTPAVPKTPVKSSITKPATLNQKPVTSNPSLRGGPSALGVSKNPSLSPDQFSSIPIPTSTDIIPVHIPTWWEVVRTLFLNLLKTIKRGVGM